MGKLINNDPDHIELHWDVFLSNDPAQGNLGGNVNSVPVLIDGHDWALDLGLGEAAETPTGTFAVLVSADHRPENHAASPYNGRWHDITSLLSPAPTQPTGAIANNFYSLTTIKPRYMYVKYTFSAGAGTARGKVQRGAI